MHSYEKKLTNIQLSQKIYVLYKYNSIIYSHTYICTCIIGGPGGSDSGRDDNTGVSIGLIGVVVGGICGAIVVMVVIHYKNGSDFHGFPKVELSHIGETGSKLYDVVTRSILRE